MCLWHVLKQKIDNIFPNEASWKILSIFYMTRVLINNHQLQVSNLQ